VPKVDYQDSTGALRALLFYFLLWVKQYKITVPNAEFVQAVSEDPLSIQPHTSANQQSEIGTLEPAYHFFDNFHRACVTSY
jgi:hypothetical protein